MRLHAITVVDVDRAVARAGFHMRDVVVPCCAVYVLRRWSRIEVGSSDGCASGRVLRSDRMRVLFHCRRGRQRLVDVSCSIALLICGTWRGVVDAAGVYGEALFVETALMIPSSRSKRPVH